jgi:hypothetical protein
LSGKRSADGQADAVRWYDGNCGEIKRLTSNLVELPDESYWVLQSTKYYIRSSVLGGATVSKVWSNGKKGKTVVRAAGARPSVTKSNAIRTNILMFIALKQA